MYLIIAQFSPLWHKSWTKPQLNDSDLLQLPYRHRSPGVAERNLESMDGDRDNQCRGSHPEESERVFSPWGLLLYVWKGHFSLIAWGE